LVSIGANFGVNFWLTPAPVLFPSAQLSGDHSCLYRRGARLLARVSIGSIGARGISTPKASRSRWP
jgi:hypothetical protein